MKNIFILDKKKKGLEAQVETEVQKGKEKIRKNTQAPWGTYARTYAQTFAEACYPFCAFVVEGILSKEYSRDS